jgi:hypothetical protein
MRYLRAGWVPFSVLLIAAPCATAQVWSTPPLIPATQQFAMVYDSVHQQTVLFGGFNDNTIAPTGTWVWNGTSWTQLFPTTSPPARYGHAMAFDPVHAQVVLFGGYDISTAAGYDDTWTWDGTNWTQQSPHVSPPARYGHAMAFDSALGVTVMFGGTGFTDTWTWNGSNWTQVTTTANPPARNAPSMVYDGARSQVVLFGGNNTLANSFTEVSLQDTWVFNGTTWTQKSPATSPPTRTFAGMAYDSGNQVTVLFGGYDEASGTTYGDTWLWNGTNWSPQSPAASPPARSKFAMSYDSTRLETVLFGGDLFSDTWTWSGTNWTEAAPPTSPPPRSAHGIAYDAARQQVVVFGGAANQAEEPNYTQPYNDTWVWNGSNWTQKTPLMSPSARSGISLVYDSLHDQTVMFGGQDLNGNPLSDTWAWDGTDWTEVATTGPSARAYYAMVYDSLRQQVVLFGGEDGRGNRFSDTWTWNGSTWTQQFPPSRPEARSRMGADYDPVHQYMLIFGGRLSEIGLTDVPVTLDETWTWNGSEWNRLFPNGANPDARAELSMSYDSAHQFTVMLGGTEYDPFASVNDSTYTFNGLVWANPGSGGSALSFPGLAFDAAHGKTVWFGGTQAGSNITQVYPAHTIVASGGTPQSTAPGQAFANPLQVTVTGLLQDNPIASDTVTFSVDPTFATLSAATATTNSNGQAQVTATATTKVGSYNVTAVIADGGSAVFALTNTGAGPAASLTETGGTGQSAQVGTGFAAPLTALVVDAAGVALSGVTVTFSAPASGAAATFSPSATVQTNAQGVASVNVSANTVSGGYDVSASVAGVSAPATFLLENLAGNAASIAPTAGTGQTTAIDTAFPTPLAATVKDAHGNLVPGATVTFSAPANGAAATFTPAASVETNAQGIATVTATANASLGGYNVTASVGGVAGSASFGLTNAGAGPATITATGGSGQSTPIGVAFATPLTAVVKNAGGYILAGVSVTFAGPASGAGVTFSPSATVVTDSSGVATVTAAANGTAGGAFTVTASVSGIATSATFSLTNTSPTYTLGVSALYEPPQSGNDATLLVVNGTPNSWTAAVSKTSPWLHLASSSTAGSNSTSLVFTFDTNTGATRTGTITINGNLVLSVIQAGGSYVKAGLITVVPLGSNPAGVAVDHNGDVFIVDGNLKEWNASTQSVSTLAAAGTAGLGSASAVATDSSGNAYVIDGAAVRKWTAASQQLSTLISTGLTKPVWLAVDSNGNLYIGDGAVVREWTASSQQLSVLISSGLNGPVAATVDPSGNLYLADSNAKVYEWSASSTQLTTIETSGVIDPVGLAADSLGNVYIADGNGAVEKYTPGTQTVSLVVENGLTLPVAIAVDGSQNLYIADSQLVFKYQASNQTLSVLVDDSYMDASTGFYQGVTTDNAGNVYLTTLLYNEPAGAVEKFNPSTRQLTTVVNGLNSPSGVAVDSAGNIYVTESGAFTEDVKKWTAATGVLSTIMPNSTTGPMVPGGVVVDPAGNVFVADNENFAVQEYNAQTGQTSEAVKYQTVNFIEGMSRDLLGNFYLADNGENQVLEWTPPAPSLQSLTGAVLNDLLDAQVDHSGNVYMLEQASVDSILKWTAATQQITVLANYSTFDHLYLGGLAPDPSGNLFINDGIQLLELPNAYVDATNVFEAAGAGQDALPPVVPASAPLYTVSSDQSWLTITGAANGVVSFAFTANTTGAARVAHITELGVTVTVTQVPNATTPVEISATGGSGQSANVGTAFATSLTATVTGAGGAGVAGISVTFSAPPNGPAATFSPSATVVTNASGVATVTATADWTIGSYTVTAAAAGVAVPAIFSLSNTVATAAYSLSASSLLEPPTAGSDSLQIVANGSPAAWSATAQASWLHIASGSASGSGSASVNFTFDANTGATRSGTIVFTPGSVTLTVTQAGSTYIPAGLIPVITSGLTNGQGFANSTGIAVDAHDNLFFTDSDFGSYNAIDEWSPVTQKVAIVTEGLDRPAGLAVDNAGNVFIANTEASALEKWTASTQLLAPFVTTGLNSPYDVALDPADDVYVSDSGDNAIKKWTAATQQVTTLVSSGLNHPSGLALDAMGNVYFGDSGNNAIKKWTAATQQVTALVSSGLNDPLGVAVDDGGNVYFCDNGNNAIKEYVASSQQIVTLVASSQLPYVGGPAGVTIDLAGNLFVDDGTGIFELPRAWVGPANVSEPNTAGADSLAQVLPASVPIGTPVSDQTWLTITGVVNGVVSFSFQLNTDAAARVAHITILGATITVTQAKGQGVPAAITLVGGNEQTAAIGLPFASPLAALVTDAGGNPLSGITVTFAGPAAGASATFSPGAVVDTDAQGIASVTAVANGAVGSYFVTASVTGVTTPAAFFLGNVAAASYIGPAKALVEPHGGGSDSLLIQASGAPGPWIAESNANWLHLLPGYTNGQGPGLVGFFCDPNPGATRSGAITLNPGGITATITQAGAAYGAAPLSRVLTSTTLGPLVVNGAGNFYLATAAGIQIYNASTKKYSTLVSMADGAYGVAIDSSGNVYATDRSAGAVLKWTASTQTVSTLISSGLSLPGGLSVDPAGNLYIFDVGSGSLKTWNAFTQQLSTLYSPLTFAFYNGQPAVDALGNVYFADSANNAIREMVAATGQIVTALSGAEVGGETVAVDGGGNLFFASLVASKGTWQVQRWSPVTQQFTIISGGIQDVADIATDGFGSVYINDDGADELYQAPRAYIGPQTISEPATAGTDSLLPVLPQTIPIYTPTSDSAWLTIASTTNDVVSFSFTANSATTAGVGHITVLGYPVTVAQLGSEAPASITLVNGDNQNAATGSAFAVPLSARVSDSAGNPMVGVTVTFAGPASGAAATFSPAATAVTNDQGIASLTAGANATAGGPYTVTATVSGVTTGANFTLTNTSSSSYSTGTTSLVEPAAAALDSLLLVANGSPAAWTAASNVAWLHLDTGSVTGTGTSRVEFYCDANTGATRSGALTLNPGGITVTVTQAGANYIPGGLTILDTSLSQEDNQVGAVAVDASDNLYLMVTNFNFTGPTGILKRSPAGQYTTVVNNVATSGIAVDRSGNIYYESIGINDVYEWNAATQMSAPLITSGLNQPGALAFDTSGNLYIADAGGVKEWNPATQQLTTITKTIASGIALDGFGNIYLAVAASNAIEEWNVATQQLSTLISGLNNPSTAAVDAAGNLYIVNNSGASIARWNAASRQLSTVGNQSNLFIQDIAIDATGNLFVSTAGAPAELTNDFIGPAAIGEPATAGSDSLFVAVPATAPLGTVASNQTWLTITGTTGGVVGFSFTANTATASRVAQITAMGDAITVTQAGTTTNPASITTTGGSGQSAPINTSFAVALTALVVDTNGNPLKGIPITYTVPASGASVTFSPSGTIYTNSQGVATVTATATGTAGGPFTVTATVTGVATPASFTLTNVGAPASISVLSGSGQSTAPGAAFEAALEVIVKDSGGNPLSGVTVMFAAPGTGASASLSPSTVVETDSAGVAAVAALANASLGTYNVTASVSGVATPATFGLANSPYSACDVNQDGTVNISDVQRMINEVLGSAAPANDVNGDGKVNVIDLQIVINGALGLGCS